MKISRDTLPKALQSPYDLDDMVGIRFHEIMVESYSDLDAARYKLRRAGVKVQSIPSSGSVFAMWKAALEIVAGTDDLCSLISFALNDRSAPGLRLKLSELLELDLDADNLSRQIQIGCHR